MFRKLKIWMVLVLLFSLATIGEGKAFASTDITPPTVKSVVFDKTSVQPGDQLHVSVAAEDVESGIKAAPFIGLKPNTTAYTDTKYISLSYNSVTNKYEGTYTVPTNAANGEWYVYTIHFEDQAGNIYYDFPTEGDPLYSTFNITGGTDDKTPPTVKSVQLDKTSVQPGDQLHVSVEATDAETGIKASPFVGLKQNTTAYTDTKYINLSYNSVTNKYEGTYTVPSNAANGEWYVYTIHFEDQAGNIYYDFPSVGDPLYVTFTVSGGVSDITPPTVKSLELDKTLVQPGESLHVSVEAVDADSGIKASPFVGLKRNTTSYTDTSYINLSYNSATNKYEGTFTVPSNAVNGEWYVYTIHFEDQAGNIFYSFPSAGSPFYKTFKVSDDIIPPAAPVVKAITDRDTTVSGTTEANAAVMVKAGSTIIAQGNADATGHFSLTIPKQTSGTTLQIIAKDAAGNESSSTVKVTTGYVKINVQLNGQSFAPGYFGNGASYVHWKALQTLHIPYTYKGNGLFIIEGRSVQGVFINGAYYMQWNQLSPGKITFTRITGGYNFIYSVASPIKVQLNGEDFTKGYLKDGYAYVYWRALDTFKIPYTFKGNGVFIIEGRTVQAEIINGVLYIRWNLLSPGKITYQRISGGYNFIYNI